MKRSRMEDGATASYGGGQAPKRSTALGGGARGPAPHSSLNNLHNKLTTNDALSYLREVKNRFQDNKEVYDTFLEIMKEFKAQRIDTSGVIARVKQLFRGHRELILGFNTFLPKGYEIELAREDDDEGPDAEANKQPVEFDQAINYVNKIKTRFANDERVYKAFLEILNMYRKGMKTITQVYDEVAVLFRSHQDLLDEFSYFLPDNSAQQQGPGQRRPGGAMQGRPRPGYPGGGRGYGQPGMGQDPRQLHKRKAAKKAEEGFRRGDYDDDDRPTARPVLARELAYFEKVKNRIRNRDAYNDFLKCLSMYSQEIISRQELLQLINDIIGRFPDLVAGFHDFLVKCDLMEVDEARLNRLAQPSMRELQKSKVHKDKYLTKPLSEIVASETERVTPSYVKMPPGYPKLASTGRTELGGTVLNDQYVNVITGSEDYSFKLMRKNQYEEALFRCEDDRYEFEMCIETNASAMRRLRPLLEKIEAMQPEDRSSYRLEDNALGPVHVRAIERLYGDQGPTLVELLRKNPAVAIPVVLGRMEQKDVEWKKVREEMTKTWKRIYEANYQKSLDHRSFYFKQAEKKLLLPKTMVAEIRDAAERRKSEERYLRSLSLAFRYDPGATADLTYDCSNRVIFQDCWEALRTAVTESLQSGLREQVLELYLRLIEPLFGLPERSEELSKLHDSQDDGGDSGGGHHHGHHSLLGLHHGNKAPEGSPAPAAAGDDDHARGARGRSAGPSGATGGDNGVKKEDWGWDTGAESKGDAKANKGGDDADDTSADIGGGKGNGAGGSRGQAAESSDEHPGRAYDVCKPLAPFTGGDAAAAAGGSSSDASSSGGQSQLLFGNENIYVFFRYHRFLYDRLWTARKCALQKAQQAAKGQGQGGLIMQAATPPPENGDGTATAEAISTDAACDGIHGQFLGMLSALLSGDLETSVYEDQVRSLLGTNSYELFTLDKLVGKIVKHMTLMLQDDSTQRLWELYRYEHRRTCRVHATTYHINCHAVLADNDTSYRIEHRPTDGGQLCITLVDPDRAEAFGAAEGYLTDYVKAYVSAPALTAPAPPEGGLPTYLRRNLPRVARALPSDNALMAALAAVHLVNGLECKVSCANSKVSYVLDTEDVMCLRRRPDRTAQWKELQTKQCAAFSQWLEDAHTRMRQEEEAIKALSATRRSGGGLSPAAAPEVPATSGQ